MLNFTFKILITDALLYLLIIAIVIFVLYARKHEHLSAPWRQIKNKKLAMSSFVILLFFIITGFLDSIHIRQKINIDTNIENQQQVVQYSSEVLSLLDLLLTKMRVQTEKTYSAPFAIHSFTKEATEDDLGKPVLHYPRLKYGGAHLQARDSRFYDISIKLLWALFWTLLVFLVCSFLIVKLVVPEKQNDKLPTCLKNFISGDTNTPWLIILLVMSMPVFFIASIVELGPFYHIMGTDQVGNDVLFKSIKSIRTGLVIGTLTTLIILPFAIVFGISAGYFRGWVDDLIQYVYTTLSSIPSVLLIVAAILSLDVYMTNNPQSFTTLIDRSDTRLLFLVMILGVTSWTGLCRLLRAETMKLRELDFVQAASSLGVRHRKIMSRHIFPNLMHIVLITIVIDFSGLVLAEAVLSYIGVGVDPTMDSWGNMINSARLELAREPLVWWNLTAAFVFMFILVLAANIFSDAVRDAFDPRLRQA